MPCSDIYINVVFEDILSVSIAEKLLATVSHRYLIHRRFHGRGSGYIHSHIEGFNAAARHFPFLVLIDLDNNECAPTLRNELLPSGASENLLLRIPVPEVEAWLLADHVGVGDFLGINERIIDRSPERLPDPKEHLFSLATRSRRRVLREAILPPQSTTAMIGPDYNGALTTFVNNYWSISRACRRADSLLKARRALSHFADHY